MMRKQVKLGDICKIKTGKYDVNHSTEDGKYPFFTCALEPFRSDTFSFDGELVLLPGNGANVGEVMYYNGKAEAYQRTYVLYDFDAVPKYVYYAIKSRWKKVLSNKQYGSATNYIRLNNITDYILPLPPLQVQQQIADTLDKADALRRKDQVLLQKYDELAQAVFYDMFGDPVENDFNWDVVTLEQLGEWRSGGTPSRSNTSYFQGTIPWLSSGELETIYVTDSREKITSEAVNNSAAKLIQPRSLLLGMYDTAALKSSINLVELCCNQAIAFAKLDDEICSTEFVYFYIQLAKEHLRREQRGVRQKNMNLSMIRNLSVINPPRTMQYKFAEVLDQIEKQKQLVLKTSQFSSSFFEGLLKENFS